tara:strand:+ start:83 stop:502 length:420 start_codon:yes stop_codon:yes gene_type:complete
VSNRLTKQEYTLKFLELLDTPPTEENIKKYNLFWWYNVRGSSGLRLTKPGYLTITKELDLKEYKFNVSVGDIKGQSRLYLDLDKFMPNPYYIHTERRGKLRKLMHISIFDEKLAMTLHLSDYNLGKYLNNAKIAYSSDL